MRIAYSKFRTKPDAVFPNRHFVSRPVAPLMLKKNGKSLSVLALVDSGADICIFPASFAAALTISIPNRNPYRFSGTADAPQIAYFEWIEATILNIEQPQQNFRFDLHAGFCDTLEHVGLGLPGQEGFFLDSRSRSATPKATSRSNRRVGRRRIPHRINCSAARNNSSKFSPAALFFSTADSMAFMAAGRW